MALTDPHLAAGLVALAAWSWIALARGRWWLEGPAPFDGEAAPPDPPEWPAVVAVVPARDEADVVERTVGALLDQDYPGPWSVVLVDDESGDGTGDRARALARRHPRGERLAVLATEPRPPGWVGKTWAMRCGVRAAHARAPEFLLLGDADVEHEPDGLRRLVARAEAERRDLVSLMVLLRCETPWERLLVPAFVYFFQLLYPFPSVRARRTAAAAGGCMLVRAAALERAGGIEAVRDRVIDDCALAAAVRRSGGTLWLGLTRRARSLRAYGGLPGVWDMVARTAYTQLRHSPSRLAGTALGMTLVFAAPPVLACAAPFSGSTPAAAAGAAAWALMAATQVATLRLYRLSPARAVLLPAAALVYLAMTLDSARRHRLGRGAAWKGRVGAGASPSSGPGPRA